MEIELLCYFESGVAACEKAIDEVAKRLDVAPLSANHGGKLETYIRRHQPGLYRRLVEKVKQKIKDKQMKE